MVTLPEAAHCWGKHPIGGSMYSGHSGGHETKPKKEVPDLWQFHRHCLRSLRQAQGARPRATCSQCTHVTISRGSPLPGLLADALLLRLGRTPYSTRPISTFIIIHENSTGSSTRTSRPFVPCGHPPGHWRRRLQHGPWLWPGHGKGRREDSGRDQVVMAKSS
jgi:hypothetical protein